MSVTALYRALVQAGAEEDIAKEAADSVAFADSINTTDERLTHIETRLTDLDVRLARTETMLKFVIGLMIANFLLLVKMAFS